MNMRAPRLLLLTVTLGIVAGCAGSDATSPNRSAPSVASMEAKAPGSVGKGTMSGGSLKGCTPRDPQYGTAIIGPSGGELIVGTHRLIVPPGALNQTVEISGSAPDAETPTIFFEPHGLQFKKPAGLILDASSCTDVPDVVYLNEIGVVSEPIPAIYSTLWRTIAVPIDHFSGYAVAF